MLSEAQNMSFARAWTLLLLLPAAGVARLRWFSDQRPACAANHFFEHGVEPLLLALVWACK